MRIGLVAPASEPDRDIFLREKLPDLVHGLEAKGFFVISVEFSVRNGTYLVKVPGNIAARSLEEYERALKA